MFALLKARTFHDEQLGDLCKSGGYWKGQLALSSYGTFRLVLSGNRTNPDEIGLDLAKQLPERLKTLIPEIQRGLFEHYSPYKEAVDSGQDTGSPCPEIVKLADVWAHLGQPMSSSNPSGACGL